MADFKNQPSNLPRCCTILIGIVVLPIAAILCVIAFLLIRELGAFPPLKAINGSYGNVLTCAVGAVAFALAYKEFRIRNTPAFYVRFVLSDFGSGNPAIAFSFKSTSNDMAHCRIRDLRFSDEEGFIPRSSEMNDVFNPGDQERTPLSFEIDKSRLASGPLRVGFTAIFSKVAAPGLCSTLDCECEISLPSSQPDPKVKAEWLGYKFRRKLW